GQVDLDGAAAGPPALDVGHEAGRQLGPVDLLQEGDPGVGGGHDQAGRHLLPPLEDDPGDPATLGGDAPDRGRGADLGPEGAGGRGHGVADPAHAALGKAPAAELAVADVADVVVGHDVGGAGGARPGPGADDPADRVHGLELGRLEILLQQVGDAEGEQPGDVGRLAGVEPAQPPDQAGLLGQVDRVP